MHCCRIVNGIKNKKHKKQPWSKVECFAFGGATVRFASLETSFHAANHTITPPPSYEGSPHCTKDKNRAPFHGEKPLMITWFLERGCINLPKRFCMVGTRYFESTEKVGRGGDIAVFFADYIWALPTFNNRWGALFRCRWGAGVWWWGVGASGWFCGGFIEKKGWIICVIRLLLVT